MKSSLRSSCALILATMLVSGGFGCQGSPHPMPAEPHEDGDAARNGAAVTPSGDETADRAGAADADSSPQDSAGSPSASEGELVQIVALRIEPAEGRTYRVEVDYVTLGGAGVALRPRNGEEDGGPWAEYELVESGSASGGTAERKTHAEEVELSPSVRSVLVVGVDASGKESFLVAEVPRQSVD